MAAPEALGAHFYRDLLSSQGRRFYDVMYRRIKLGDLSGSCELHGGDANCRADVFAAFNALRDDHPEFFFLPYESRCSGTDKRLEFSYTPLYPPDMIVKINDKLTAKIDNIVYPAIFFFASCRLTLEEHIYRLVSTGIEYKNNDDFRDHSIVAPVLFNEGVCEGINALLILCLRKAGFPCIKISGKTNRKSDSFHAWCIVWIDDIPVHLDATWDKPIENNVRFDYFNLSDSQISKDHFDYHFPGIPYCKYNVFDYYRSKSLCVHSREQLPLFIKREKLDNTYTHAIRLRLSYDSDNPLRDVTEAIKFAGLRGNYRLYYNDLSGNMLVCTD